MRVDDPCERRVPFGHRRAFSLHPATAAGAPVGERLNLVDRYLELALRLGRHVDGGEPTYGPTDLRERIDAEPPVDPVRLAEDARARSRTSTGTGSPKGSAGAGSRRARRHRDRGAPAGGRVDPVHRPGEPLLRRPPRARSRGALRGGASPGRRRGSAAPATSASGTRPGTSRSTCPPSMLPLVRLTADFQSRTQALVELPAGEDAELELVEDERWVGVQLLPRRPRSRVVVNTDVPMQAAFVAELVAHELYPGHHTERDEGAGAGARARLRRRGDRTGHNAPVARVGGDRRDRAGSAARRRGAPRRRRSRPPARDRLRAGAGGARPRGPGRARIGADERGAHAPSAGSEPSREVHAYVSRWASSAPSGSSTSRSRSSPTRCGAPTCRATARAGGWAGSSSVETSRAPAPHRAARSRRSSGGLFGMRLNSHVS